MLCDGECEPGNGGEGVESGVAEGCGFDGRIWVKGDGGYHVYVADAGDGCGGCFFGGVGGIRIEAANDDSCKGEAVYADCIDGEEGVVYGAKCGSGDDDDREAELVGDLKDIDIWAEGDADAADAFDYYEIAYLADLEVGVFDAAVVDGMVFEGCADNGCGGCGVGDGVYDIKRKLCRGEFCKAFGIGADEAAFFGMATGGDWFEDSDTMACLREYVCDSGGDEGFSDPGIGSGYEEAGFRGQTHN